MPLLPVVAEARAVRVRVVLVPDLVEEVQLVLRRKQRGRDPARETTVSSRLPRGVKDRR